MTTASDLMARGPRYRTPEEHYRAYQQFMQDIAPIQKAVVNILAVARPHLHLHRLPDGGWEIISDPDRGLTPELRAMLTMLEARVREMAVARGLMRESDDE
jgi:hypothetical protein